MSIVGRESGKAHISLGAKGHKKKLLSDSKARVCVQERASPSSHIETFFSILFKRDSFWNDIKVFPTIKLIKTVFGTGS